MRRPTGSWTRSPRWSPSSGQEPPPARALRPAGPAADRGRIVTRARRRQSRAVAVMGSGSWGTAFALVLSDAQNQVTLWARRPELAAMINSEHRNADYFPTIALPATLRAVQRSAARRWTAPTSSYSPCRPSRCGPIWTTGRFRDGHRGQPGQGHRAGHRAADEPGDRRGRRGHRADRIAVVTGPNLAREIAERQPSASVVASVVPDTAEALQAVCHTAAVPGLHQHRRGGLRARRARPRT